jgi:hypothetical protein
MKKIILYLLLCISTASFGQLLTYKTFVVTNAGGSVTIASTKLPYYIYVYPSTGNVVLANDWSIALTGGFPAKGTTFRVFINGNFDLNGHTLSIFGYNLEAYMVNTSTGAASWYYDFAFIDDGAGGTAFTYCNGPQDFNRNNSLQGYVIADGSLPIAKLDGAIPKSALDTTGRGRVWVGTGANVTSSLYAAGSGKVLLGDGSDLTSVAVTGDIGISSTGVTSIAAGAIVNADVSASAAIARSKLAAGTASQVVVNDGAGVLTSEATLNPLRGGLGADVSSSTGFVTFSAGSSTVGALVDSKTFTVSFESGEQCNNRFKMPCAGTVTGAYAVCTKAIASTDAGTIVLKNAAGTTMTAGTVTFAASDPLETAYTVTPTANNTFAAGDILYAVTSKTTAGGKVLLTITYNRVN